MRPGCAIVFQQQHAATALARDCSAHQPGGTGTQHNHIEFADFARHSFIVAERKRSNILRMLRRVFLNWRRHFAAFIFSSISFTRFTASVSPIFSLTRTSWTASIFRPCLSNDWIEFSCATPEVDDASSLSMWRN